MTEYPWDSKFVVGTKEEAKRLSKDAVDTRVYDTKIKKTPYGQFQVLARKKWRAK